MDREPVQVTTDARSGITTGPNWANDPEYSVRLIKRVVDKLATRVDKLAAVGVKAEATASVAVDAE